MKKNLAFKFRCYPTPSQEEYFNKCFKVNNFIYNFALGDQKDIDDILSMYGISSKEERSKYKTKHKLWFDKFQTSNLLTEFSKEKFTFLREVDSTMRAITLDKLDKAFKSIKKTGAGFPRFKNKFSNKSFTGAILYNGKIKPQNFSIQKEGKWALINIPNSRKIGSIKTVIHRENFLNRIQDKNQLKLIYYTISLNKQNQYHISVTVEEEVPDISQLPIDENTSIGIDRGIERPVTTSIEEDFDSKLFGDRFDLIKKQKEKITKLERILAKKRERNPTWKTSKKYIRLKNELAKLHGKVANQRENLQHNITKKLVDKEDVNTFVLEDLKIKNMTKRSAKGKSKQKRHMSRSILDVGMFGIESKLAYKVKWAGKNIVKVAAQYTSQRCNDCGHINKQSRISQAVFSCVKCGVEQNADLNAAKNIKDKFFGNFRPVLSV